MAVYTFHWTFAVNDKTYHIYGSHHKTADHNFGANKPHGKVADPYYRINLKDKALKIDDHGTPFGGMGFAKDKPKYEQQADLALASGKMIFVINCHSGIMRSSIMAMTIYKRLTGATTKAAMSAFRTRSAKGEKYAGGSQVKSEVKMTDDMYGCMEQGLGV